MDALELLASDSYITFSKPIAKKYGVNAAILLGQLCSWQKHFGGEFFKSQDELAQETCLGLFEVRGAITALKESGILQVTLKGLPAKNYYLVSTNKLCENQQTSCVKITKQDVEKSQNYNNKNTTYKNTNKKNTNNTKESIREKPTFGNFNLVIELYNTVCTSLPRVTIISPTRETMIQTRLKEFGYEKISEVFHKAEASNFLTGKNGKSWRANFDWLMKASNFVKVLDGNYDNKGKSAESTDDLPF